MISITDGERIRLSKKLLLAAHKEIMESNEKNTQPVSTSAFKKGTGIDPEPWNRLMPNSETIPRLFLFFKKCQRYLHEGRPDQISPWDIFLS